VPRAKQPLLGFDGQAAVEDADVEMPRRMERINGRADRNGKRHRVVIVSRTDNGDWLAVLRRITPLARHAVCSRRESWTRLGSPRGSRRGFWKSVAHPQSCAL